MSIYNTYSEKVLVSLLNESNHSAFDEIFTRFNKILYSHVYNKLRDTDAARDIVQDVFIKLWENRSTIRGTNLCALLFTMSRNRILNDISHQKIVTEHLNQLIKYRPANEITADYMVREKQMAAIIEKEIEALPTRMKEIFKLSRNENLSNKEIAARLSLSEHTIADQIKKALRLLRLRIGLSIFILFL